MNFIKLYLRVLFFSKKNELRVRIFFYIFGFIFFGFTGLIIGLGYEYEKAYECIIFGLGLYLIMFLAGMIIFEMYKWLKDTYVETKSEICKVD